MLEIWNRDQGHLEKKQVKDRRQVMIEHPVDPNAEPRIKEFDPEVDEKTVLEEIGKALAKDDVAAVTVVKKGHVATVTPRQMRENMRTFQQKVLRTPVKGHRHQQR